MSDHYSANVVVFVEGGIVQEVVTDSEGVRVMVVDYDNEKSHGRIERGFEAVVCDPTRVALARESMDRNLTTRTDSRF